MKGELPRSLFHLSIQWLGTGCLMTSLLSEVLQTTERISEIVRAVNAIGAAPSDLVAILEALKQAGALRAELIIL